ncbi:hypothetical protein [Leadbetterella sp. DM7]|uniref:hypothetical protein n=1 Tax=Leadbetterella sp. DM7 TaxID=3235085 RepID=UPI00349EBA55
MSVFVSYNSKNEDFAELVKMKIEKEALQKGAQGSTNRSSELIDLITTYVKPVKG